MTAVERPADIPALTSIRGIAAWWVVLYHVRAMFVPHVSPGVMAFLGKGYLAVDMFFVLSGFVIYLNYAHRIVATRVALADFFIRRVARIYPLHLLLWLATCLFALAVYWRTGVRGDEYPLREFFLGLFLVQNWGFADSQTWNVPAWSISTEFAAYLVFPLFLLGLRIRRWPWPALVLLGVGLILGLHTIFEARGYTRLGSDIPGLGLFRCLAQFLTGALLCELYLRRPSGRIVAPALLATAVLITIGVTLYGLVETLWLPFLWAALILGLALLPPGLPNPLNLRPLVYLGEVSYGTYLSHYLSFIVFKLLLVEVAGRVSIPLIALFLALVLTASIVLYHAFERPAQRGVMHAWRALALKTAKPPLAA